MAVTHRAQCLGQSLPEIIESVENLTHQMLPIINFINLRLDTHNANIIVGTNEERVEMCVSVSTRIKSRAKS